MKHFVVRASVMAGCFNVAHASINIGSAQPFVQNVPDAAVGFDLAPTRAYVLSKIF